MSGIQILARVAVYHVIIVVNLCSNMSSQNSYYLAMNRNRHSGTDRTYVARMIDMINYVYETKIPYIAKLIKCQIITYTCIYILRL